MKKLKYLSALILAAGITACSQYEEPNPKVPVTSQETLLIRSEILANLPL